MSKSSWPRRLLRIGLWLGLLLGVLLIAVMLMLPYAVPWLAQQQGINLHWEDPQWRHDGLSVAQLQITLPSDDLQAKRVHVENLRVHWTWAASPIQSLQATRVQVDWPSSNDQTSTDVALPVDLLRWLPQRVELQEIDVKLPGIGHLQGSLDLDISAQRNLWQPAYIKSDLSLEDLQGTWLDNVPTTLRPKKLSAQINTQINDSGQQLLTINVNSDQAIRAQIKGSLHVQQTPGWKGTLENAQMTVQLDTLDHPMLAAERLQAHINFSAQADSEQFSLAISEHSSLQAQNLQVPDMALTERVVAQLAGLTIAGPTASPLEISVHSPIEVRLENLNADQLHTQNWDIKGTVSGQLAKLEINASLTNQHGLGVNGQIRLSDKSLQGRATLKELSFEDVNPLKRTLKTWPDTDTLNHGQMHAQLDFNLPDDGLFNLEFSAGTNALSGLVQGTEFNDLNLAINGQLEIRHTLDWQIALKNTTLAMHLGRLAHPAVTAKKLQMNAELIGQADAHTFTTSVSNRLALEAQEINLQDIGQADKLTVQLSDLNVKGRSATPYAINVNSTLKARVETLKSAQLHTQSWDLKGTLSGQLPKVALNATLSGEQGLNLTSQIDLEDGAVKGSAVVNEVFFKAGNPLKKTFKAWPELISFDSGRLFGQVDFSVPVEAPLRLSLKGHASGLSGIVNRSELNNLDFALTGQLSDDVLTLDIPKLTIGQLDPGIQLASIQLTKARYRASLNRPLQGVVNWQSVKANILNGTASLGAETLDLRRVNKLLLHVEGLELEEVFRVYPAEGLAGTGIIDGQIPIYVGDGKFHIEAGQLQARRPGVLQFRSEKIRDLARSNSAMRIVADALEDFHFKLLSSAVSYEQSGKLLLNIRLEGQNPDVEKGRPIHLNLNLEEDIPALLASIQLSGQVNEIIQKRIHESLEKR